MEPIFDIGGRRILVGTYVVDDRGLSYRALDTERTYTDSSIFRAEPVQFSRFRSVLLKPETVAVIFDYGLAESRTAAARRQRAAYYQAEWERHQSDSKRRLFRQRQQERDADLREKGYRNS